MKFSFFSPFILSVLLTLSVSCSDIVRNPTGKVVLPEPISVKLTVEGIEGPRESLHPMSIKLSAKICVDSVKYLTSSGLEGVISLGQAIELDLSKAEGVIDQLSFTVEDPIRMISLYSLNQCLQEDHTVSISKNDETRTYLGSFGFRFEAESSILLNNGTNLHLQKLASQMVTEFPLDETDLSDFLSENVGLLEIYQEGASVAPLSFPSR